MRDIYLILNTVIAIALIVLSLVSLINDRKPLLNKLFLAFAFCIGVWLVSACISNDTRNSPTVSLYGNYAVFVFSYFSSNLLLWFAVLLTSMHAVKRIMLFWNVPLVLVGIVSGTPLVVAGVELQGNVYAVVFGPLAFVYLICLAAQLALALWVFTVSLRTLKGRKKAQIKLIQRSLVVAIPILIITQFIAPAITGSFEITDIGILAMALPVVSLYLSVVRHGLFDIRHAIIRSVNYILSLTTLAAIYYVFAYFISLMLIDDTAIAPSLISPLSITLALVLAFIFQPIKRFFNKVTNKFFYKDDYNTDDFFARLNKTMTITTDLRDLLERASHEISSTLKSEQAFFFIYTNAEHYVSAGTAKHKQLPKRDAIELGGCKDTHDGLIVAALLDSSDPIHRLMLSHEIEIVLPLRQNGQSLGYLCLGNQKNSGYTIRDMKVLSTIADELVIAIQNALSVQEVKDLNENLQQRIDLATKELRASNAQLQRLDKAKDEFVSMASHQLRTPLTSIKGYISMILDGDVGKVNDNMKQMLDEAFMSSERMVHLINDFLSMSRIQTGRFMIEKTESDLSKVVKQEIDSLQ